MSKYVIINFTNTGRPTDIWTDDQIRAYKAFKETAEHDFLIRNISSEFMEDKDILEVLGDVREIFDIAEIFGIELGINIDIYTSYKYDIIRAIKEHGLPQIIDNFGRNVTISYEDGNTPQEIINAFEELGINLDDVNVAGQWGGKMVWVVNGQIFTVIWEKEDKNDIQN